MARAKQRETYGTGSVTPKKGRDGKQLKNKQGLLAWAVQVSFGYENVVGKDGKVSRRQRRVQRTVYGSLADARAEAQRIAKQYEQTDVTVAKEMTFAKACDAWEASMRVSGKASPNALKGYLTNLGHMRALIGDHAITQITKQDIEEALATIKEARGLGGTTMHKLFGVTKRVFAYAVDSGWVGRNPCDRVESPRINQHVDRHSLTEEEYRRFARELDRAESDAIEDYDAKERRLIAWSASQGRSVSFGISDVSCIMALRLELATGMRRSEVLGLTWDAVDLDSGVVTVRQALIEEKAGKGNLTNTLSLRETKSQAGVRQISLDGATVSHLVRWKSVQESMLANLMPDGCTPLRQTSDTPVCIGDKGSWLAPARITHWWGTKNRKGFRDEIGFPGLLMHELRHTQATLLLGNGVDIKTVQARLGHAKPSLTLEMYAHAMPARDRAAADLMGGIAARQQAPDPTPNPPAPQIRRQPSDKTGRPAFTLIA